MESQPILATGFAALLFAFAFLVGGRVHPLRSLIRDRRSLLSFGAGVSVAYVFVHVMPELHDARRVLGDSVSAPLRYEGMVIYFLALVGFLLFYGLDHLRKRLSEPFEEGQTGRAFKLHVGGFAAYVWLMGYLLVHSLEGTMTATVLFTVAVIVHFVCVDHALREEHGAAYQRIGRFVLAAASLLGWGAGLLVALPHAVLALLVAFISGAVIMNSLIMELPSEKDGRFLPFMCGGLLYGLMLLPLG